MLPHSAVKHCCHPLQHHTTARLCQAMANPFEAFSFQAAPPPKQTTAASARAPTAASSPQCNDPTTPSRRRRQPVSPPPSDADAAPAPATRRATRGANNGSQTKVSTPVKKKRKAYAFLTGPPKGLGPKLGTTPLRLVLIGHNPSEHAFHTGHFYSNPSNRMWPILISTGIAPAGTTGPEADDTMPSNVGVGFIDVGSGQPGTDSALFTSEDFQQWRGAFYERLKQHVAAASAAIGCTCGACGAPALVAFTGKRQYLELLNIDATGQLRRGKQKVNSATVQLGKQPPDMLPPGWPLPVDRTEVWVLTSTSGAAPMSNADRERPYQQLAERLAQVPWPRSDIVSCSSQRS